MSRKKRRRSSRGTRRRRRSAEYTVEDLEDAMPRGAWSNLWNSWDDVVLEYLWSPELADLAASRPTDMKTAPFVYYQPQLDGLGVARVLRDGDEYAVEPYDGVGGFVGEFLVDTDGGTPDRDAPLPDLMWDDDAMYLTGANPPRLDGKPYEIARGLVESVADNLRSFGWSVAYMDMVWEFWTESGDPDVAHDEYLDFSYDIVDELEGTFGRLSEV